MCTCGERAGGLLVRRGGLARQRLRSQPMLHTAGRPDEQSSVGSSQHSSFSALVRSSRSAHAPPLCCRERGDESAHVASAASDSRAGRRILLVLVSRGPRHS